MYQFTAALLALCALPAWAFNPETDRAACTNGRTPRSPCLTSFIWCGLPQDASQGCSFPPNAYPYFYRDNSNFAGLVQSQQYRLSWRNHDNDYPVMIRWSFGPEPDEPSRVPYRWSRNVTGSYLDFSFADLITDFPTELSNITTIEAEGFALDGSGTFSISQPDRPLPPGVSNDTSSSAYYADYSNQFWVLSSTAPRFIAANAEMETDRLQRRWTLGVGIAVGLGVPILLAGSFVGGWLFGKGRGRNAVAGEPKKLSASS